MSVNLSPVAVTEFDSMVKHAYQNASLLRNAVTVRNNVVGDTYKFRNMGKGTAAARGTTSTDVSPMNVAHSLVTATLANYVAPEYTDIFDAAEVNFDEKQELAQTIAGALGRRLDDIVISAMDAATPGATVALVVLLLRLLILLTLKLSWLKLALVLTIYTLLSVVQV